MDLKLQKRLAADVLKASEKRIWFDETRVNDIWFVDVTPFDTQDNGSTVRSNNVTILRGNIIPNVSNVVLNASSVQNFTTDNLTVTALVTDADGDPTTLVENWEVNGLDLLTLNMPLNINVTNSIDDVPDYSSFNDNGTLGNGTIGTRPAFTLSCAKGGCYEFDGQNDFIDVNATGRLRNSVAFTVEAWVRKDLDNLGSLPKMISMGDFASADDADFDGFHIDLINDPTEGTVNTTRFFLFNSTSGRSAVQGSTVLGEGSFHHIVAVMNGTHIRLFVNGTEDTTPALINGTVAYDAQHPFRIGALSNIHTTANAWSGAIDEVRVYNRSLSEEQIAENYNSGTAHFNITNSADVISFSFPIT